MFWYSSISHCSECDLNVLPVGITECHSLPAPSPPPLTPLPSHWQWLITVCSPLNSNTHTPHPDGRMLLTRSHLDHRHVIGRDVHLDQSHARDPGGTAGQVWAFNVSPIGLRQCLRSETWDLAFCHGVLQNWDSFYNTQSGTPRMMDHYDLIRICTMDFYFF